MPLCLPTGSVATTAQYQRRLVQTAYYAGRLTQRASLFPTHHLLKARPGGPLTRGVGGSLCSEGPPSGRR